jgi:hypothetical protein
MPKTHEEIHKLFVGTFETELGKRTIAHLTEKFVDRNMYESGMTLDQVAFRQGEASTIKKIIKELNNG